ncbi:acyl-CoA dehydrogenase family protein [Phytohabitans suffuscus]|uniref:Acyl-CoA dehydrogenase n=1 Tax=Phytohabitans suffuscus TaxID=624315 RepID=A0A6F8YQZ5_9ACTN|nr:acyl-CoA dehydrogenase family protein [Phytohabitans suffuscus]BCB88615.1 acyl-CoA dehydrogenase [Phytohabitans suffuscus]
MTSAIADSLERFVRECVIPSESAFAAEGGVDTARSSTLTGLQDEARERGLWNLFSSAHPSAALRDLIVLPDLAELVGLSPILAQAALHALNPDALVMELLTALGTDEQRDRWLPRLTDGAIASGYCMSEPDVASSDPRSLRMEAKRSGDGFLVSGRKSWCTGASTPGCRFLVVVAVTEPEADPRRRHSLLLVERNDPGVKVVAERRVLGYSDALRGGHPDIEFQQARGQLLGAAGDGLSAAQQVLGPARMLHSMRLVGTAERALGLMTARLGARNVGGRALASSDLWIDRVGGARIDVEGIRALVRAMVTHPDRALAESIVKAHVPGAVARIVDLAIQAHGADGLSSTTILADLYAHARSLQISDGPDEVHRRVVGRRELRAR